MRFASKHLFALTYGVLLALLAAVDGALLSGVAAVITALGGIALGLLAYRRGMANGGNSLRPLAEAQARAIATQAEQIERLEEELARGRGRGRAGRR